MDELGLKPYSPEAPRNPRITFGDVVAHYVKFELPDDQTNATIEKAQSTIAKYKHYLNRWVLPEQLQRVLSMAVDDVVHEKDETVLQRSHVFQHVLRRPEAVAASYGAAY